MLTPEQQARLDFLNKKAGVPPASAEIQAPPPQAPAPTWADKAKTFGSQLLETTKEQGKGIAGSFGVDLRTPEQQQMEGSVMASPQEKSNQLSRKIGGYAGDVGMMMGGEELVKLAEPALKELFIKYGMGPVKAAMARASMLGPLYESAKGAVNRTPPSETLQKMAVSAPAWGMLGAVGHGVGKLGEALTKDTPEYLANQYVNPSKAMGEKTRRNQLKTSVPSEGRQFLDKTKFGIGTSKNEVYNEMAGELEKNRAFIGSKLEQGTEAGKPSASKSEGVYEKGALGEPSRVSDLDPKKSIDLDEVRARLGPIMAEQGDIGKDAMASAIAELTDTVAKGERIVSPERAYELLTELDAEVNNAYLKTPNNIPPGTEARAAMATGLREQIYQKYPEVAEMAHRNHYLMNTQAGLLPQISGSGGGSFSIPGMAKKLLGSRAGLGVARTLDSPVTEGIVQGSAPAVKGQARLGLSQQINDLQHKGERTKEKK